MKNLLSLCVFLCSSAAFSGNGSTKVCFSPDNDCMSKLVNHINTAESTLDVAIYTFTAEEVFQALKNRKDAGVTVRVVIDRSQGDSSQLSNLLSASIPVKFGNVPRLMHHKFTIVDSEVLQLGSFNYTLSANDKNAENQVYTDDKFLVGEFKEEFEKLWSEGLPVD